LRIDTRPPVQRAGGFSLLEVLVAFSILALALGVLMRIFSGGVHLAALSEDYSRAVLLAESRMEELSLEGELDAGTDSGRFDARYRWETTIEPYSWEKTQALNNLPFEPFQITVEVYWREAERQRSISLTTLQLISKG
jgi:general secretion pathway protein I